MIVLFLGRGFTTFLFPYDLLEIVIPAKAGMTTMNKFFEIERW